MTKVALRYQQLRDAKKFWEILNNPEFILFPVQPKTVKEERYFLRMNLDKRIENVEHNFAVTLHGDVVDAIGITIDQRRQHVGGIGYFVERKYWGKGIASRSVKLIEDFTIKRLDLYRI